MAVRIPAGQIGWIVGLATCITGALLSEGGFDGVWERWLTRAFIVGTAVSGYMIRRPLPVVDEQRESPPPPPSSKDWYDKR